MEEKKTNWLLIVVVALIVIAVGLASFLVGKNYGSKSCEKEIKTNVENKENAKKENVITDEEALSEGKRLYNKAFDTMWGMDILKTNSSGDNEDYDIPNSSPDITELFTIINWEEVTKNLFTAEFLRNIENDKNLASSFGLEFTDGKAYFIDEYNDYSAPTLRNITIASKTEDTIKYNVEVAGLSDCPGMFNSCGEPDSINRSFTVKKVNGAWLIDEFYGDADHYH